MKIERHFNENSNINIDTILKTIINDRIDAFLNELYDNNQVNTASSLSDKEVA